MLKVSPPKVKGKTQGVPAAAGPVESTVQVVVVGAAVVVVVVVVVAVTPEQVFSVQTGNPRELQTQELQSTVKKVPGVHEGQTSTPFSHTQPAPSLCRGCELPAVCEDPKLKVSPPVLVVDWTVVQGLVGAGVVLLSAPSQVEGQ